MGLQGQLWQCNDCNWLIFSPLPYFMSHAAGRNLVKEWWPVWLLVIDDSQREKGGAPSLIVSRNELSRRWAHTQGQSGGRQARGTALDAMWVQDYGQFTCFLKSIFSETVWRLNVHMDGVKRLRKVQHFMKLSRFVLFSGPFYTYHVNKTEYNESSPYVFRGGDIT